MENIEITSPYKNVEQYTRIKIEPYQMNSDIRNHLKYNLKKKIENKCNKNGFIIELYRITNYSDGIMHPENLSGNVIYNVSYHCKICIPIENTIIIGQIKIINPELIIAVNGPIMIFISKDYVDTNYWNPIENYIHTKKENVKLNIENYVCIEILNKRINKNDTQIKTIGRLLDLATEEQVNLYFGSDINNEKSATDTNFI
jgi:hypothetical protein